LEFETIEEKWRMGAGCFTVAALLNGENLAIGKSIQ
jgi:hypothetical protein